MLYAYKSDQNSFTKAWVAQYGAKIAICQNLRKKIVKKCFSGWISQDLIWPACIQIGPKFINESVGGAIEPIEN